MGTSKNTESNATRLPNTPVDALFGAADGDHNGTRAGQTLTSVCNGNVLVTKTRVGKIVLHNDTPQTQHHEHEQQWDEDFKRRSDL